MMSAENTIPDKVSGTYSECVECHKPADSANTLTWVMAREDIELRNMADVKAFLERSEGRPYIMVLPEDEEIKVYSVAWYCDDCLDRYLDVYEKRHTSSDKLTKADLQERILQLARDTDWLIYVRDLSHMVPRGFPDLALIREDEVIFPTLRGDVSMRLRLLRKGHIAVLNHLSAKLYWLNLGNWKYFFCRMPLTNRSLICSKQVVHTAWVRTKVLPFNQMSSTGFSCGV